MLYQKLTRYRGPGEADDAAAEPGVPDCMANLSRTRYGVPMCEYEMEWISSSLSDFTLLFL